MSPNENFQKKSQSLLCFRLLLVCRIRLRKPKGVEEVYSGYAGGKTKNPTYNQVISGRTGHAETVEVIYDPNVINFATLVEVFFDS